MSKISSIAKNKDRLKKHELTELILRTLGGLMLIGGTFAIPTLPFAYFTVVKIINSFTNGSVPERKIRRSLIALEARDIVSLEIISDEMHVKVKDIFHKRIIKYSLKSLMKFKKETKTWRGDWFLVFFDVPEIQRIKRNELRNLLVFIGFQKYQQSVFIYPYECKDEVDLIRRIAESGKYLRYVVASEIEDEIKFKESFNLK